VGKMSDSIEFETAASKLIDTGELFIRVPHGTGLEAYRRIKVTVTEIDAEPKEPELKPCPFCGGEVTVSQVEFAFLGLAWVAECVMGCFWKSSDTRADVVERANRRSGE